MLNSKNEAELRAHKMEEVSVAARPVAKACNQASGESRGGGLSGFKHMLSTFLDSKAADMGLGMIIVVNAVCIGIGVDTTDHTPTALSILENVFVAVYTVECACRIFVLGREYFTKVSTIFDFCIACISIVDTWVLTPMGTTTNLNLIKLLRLVRLVRILRIIKVMRVFHHLTEIVRALTLSMNVLLWTVVLALLFTYVWALTFRVVLDLLILEPIESLVYKTYFASNISTAFTFLQILTSSDSHEHVVRPLMRSCSWPMMVYLLIQVYLILVRFGLIATAVGVFVLNVHENERRRAKERTEADMRFHKPVIEQIASVFQAKEITLVMFETAFNHPRLNSKLRQLDINWLDPVYLFHIIDSERKGFITRAQLVSQLVRIKQGVPLLAMKAISDSLSTVSAGIDRLHKRLAERQPLNDFSSILNRFREECELKLACSENDLVIKRKLGYITKYV